MENLFNVKKVNKNYAVKNNTKNTASINIEIIFLNSNFAFKISWQLNVPFWCSRMCDCAQGERDSSFSLQFAGLR